MENIEHIKEYSKELADQMQKAISTFKIKEIKGNGTFKVIATTASVDRDGESILVEGWVFENFMKNPIILFGHNYWDMCAIIGAATTVYIEGKDVIIEGVFADTEEGQYIRKLYDDGILKTVSVGFIPLERQGNVITKAELLELSFVPVPCNPEALSMAKAIKAAQDFEQKFLKTETQKTEGENENVPVPVPKETEETIVKVSKNSLEKMKADISSILDSYVIEGKEQPSIKAGRVLSSKNETLVKTALGAVEAVVKPLQDLLAAVNDPAEEGKLFKPEDAKVLADLLKGADKLIEKAICNVKPLAKK